MAEALDEGLAAGGFGVSSGLIYPPGMYSDTDELVGLARVAARRNRIFTSHIRGSSETLLAAVDELIEVGRASGAAVHHSHSEALGRGHWWKVAAVLEREERAAAGGVPISFDMFPYTAAATTMLAIYPPWSLEGGVDRLLERLADPLERRRIERDIETLVPQWPPWAPGAWPHNLVRAAGWEGILVGSTVRPESRSSEFVTLAELGARQGKSPFDAVSDLMLAERGQVSQLIFMISGSPEEEDRGEVPNLDRLLAHPLGIVASDANDFGTGRPHPAAFGAFPRILARFVRRGVCPLGTAIRKMTSRPAELFGIRDRGRIREDYFADLVLLDCGRIQDRATYRSPRQPPDGVDSVWINGRLVLDEGIWTEDAPGAGSVLRR
jgi:N-acyl-D-aspartate/D-glutamate deacylase